MKRAILFTFFSLFVMLAPTARASVLRVTVDDTIQPVSDEFIGHALDQAALEKDSLVVIELRTPGGLEDSMRQIVEKIFHSRVPVAVFVSPSGSRAASAGFVILESADIAAMAPGTNAGAAHPVFMDGSKMDDIMKTKVENDSAAFIRSIAQKRGRNVAVAESAVRESKSFTEQEALNAKLIDLIEPDVPSLIHALDGRAIKRFDGTTTTLHLGNAPVHAYEMSIKQRILSTLMDPNVAFLLLVIGALAIFAEFNHPGAVVPGVVGIIAVVLALLALNLLPTRFAALGLLLVAFILFGLEAKFTTHGVLGIGGVVSMILGALLLVDGPIPEMRVHVLTALVVSIPLGAIAVFLMTLGLRVRNTRVVTGSEGMIGQIGIAQTQIEPAGKVFVRGELWNAIAVVGVPQGARVRVNAVDGLHLVVEQLE